MPKRKLRARRSRYGGADFYAVGQMFDMPSVWAEMAENLQTVAIPQCGHLPQEEQPEMVTKLLMDFLDGWVGEPRIITEVPNSRADVALDVVSTKLWR
jgi:hypothetical protein